MITRAEAEIREFCEDLWRSESGDRLNVGWNTTATGGLLFVSMMYQAPDLTLDHLLALARFFGTMNVGAFGDIIEPGCETCDYGSRYGFSLRVEPGPTPPEPNASKPETLTRKT